MVREAESRVESLNGGNSGRIYLEKLLMTDSAMPFNPNQDVRVEVVETAGGDGILAVVPVATAVDQEASEVVLERPTAGAGDERNQAELEADGGGRDP